MAEELLTDEQDSPPKLSVSEFAGKIKAKYPAYALLDDNDLVNKIITKYPAYASQVDLEKKSPVHSDSESGPIDFINKFPSSSAQADGTSILGTGLTYQEKGNDSGFRVVDPNQLPSNNEHAKAQWEAYAKQAATKDPGTWSLFSVYAPINTGLASITDALSGYSKAIENAANFGHPEVNVALSNLPIPTKISPLFDWASDYLKEGAKENPLPDNFGGQLVKGLGETTGKIAPVLLSGGTAAAPEASAELTGSYLTNSQLVQAAVTKAAGTMTQYLGAVGAGEGLKRGSDESGGKILPTLLEGLKGGQEGIESGVTLEAQMGGGEWLGSKLFGLALKTGVVNEEGVITQQALKSVVASPTVFGLYSVANDVANQRPVNWQEAGVSAATALPFEAQHLIGAVGEAGELKENKAKLDQHINDAIETTNANSIINFATADPDDIVKAMQRPETAGELQIQALAKGVEAQNAKTAADKNTLHLAQLELQQQADIKSIGETVVQHGMNGFMDAVNNTELPDNIKSTLISKAHGITQEFNPVVKEQAETQQTVTDLTSKIDDLQNTPGATDPITNPAGVNELIDLVEKRTDAQVDLLDKVADNPDQVPNRPILYHGSADNFDAFSPEHLGLFTGGDAAKKGFFFTNSEDVAHTYRKAGVIDRPNIDGLKEHLESLSENELKDLHKTILGKYGYTFDPEHPKDAIDDLIDAAKEDKGKHIADKNYITDQIARHSTNENRDYEAYETKGTLHQVHLDTKNPLIIDGKGADKGEFDVAKIIDEAKSSGHDGVIIRNVLDEAALDEKGAQHEPSDIHIVFNPDQIKKLGKDEQAQKETETAPPEPGADTSAASEGNGLLEGGFHFKSKDHGQLNIVPAENGEYSVHFNDGTTFKGTPEEIKLAIPDFDESKIGADERTSELHGTDNKNEIARIYDEKVKELQEPSNGIENAIAAYGPKTDAEKFAQTDDRNNITGGIRLNYFRKEGTDAGSNNHLDTQATEINNLYFNGVDKVSEQDIVDFMKKYPGGTKSFYTAKGNPELREIADRYKSITGKELTNKRAAQLAAKYTDVTAAEIRDIEDANEGKEVTDRIKQFITDHLDKPGLNDPAETIKNLENEFDRYLQDPDNEFNLFHDDFKGDILNEEDIKQIRDAISEAKDEQLADNTNDQESENETGSDASGQEAEGSEGEPVDDIPFQRGGGTEIPRERADVIQKLMEKVFPNVETIFHPTVEDFAAAAKVNHINAEDLPNAFVDKNGKINFNPEAIHADTQIHEYGHILTQWAKENAPALFKRMIAFGRDAKDIQTELKGNGYKMTESRMAEEAFVTMLGRHGEGKLDEVIKNSGTRGTISKFINDLWTKFHRYLIEKTGFDISKFKNIKDMPINEFLDTINSKYLLSENKIADIGTKEYSQIDEQKSNKPVRMADETMADYFKRVIEWTREQKTGQKGIDFTGEADKPEERPGYNFSETSIKNRVVKEERRARFLDEVESVNKRDFGQVWEAGKKMVDDGTKVMRGEGGFVEGLIKNPRPLMPEETAALTYDRMRLYNQHRAIMDNINDAMETNNAGAETEHRAALSAIEYEINQNDIAAKQVGYEQGAGLAARKMMAAQDYTLANQVQLATIANNGKELPSDVRMKMESLDKQLREAQKKLDDYEANEKARAAVTSLARLRKEVENEKRLETKQKRTKTAEQIDKSIAERKQAIYDKLFKNKSATSSPIPYADRLIEITPDLALLAKDYIRKGINTVEGLVDQLHDDLKDHLEGLTKRDLRDALSGYGKNSKPSKDTIDKQLRELKSQARLTSALEDAQRGERPLKSGYTHDMPSEAVRELQKKVHDAMRENGIEVEHKKISDEDAWKSALESVKTRLKNEIQDLNKQLETGVKPDKKASVILDQEATDLKAERDRLKAAIDEVEGNKELTDEQRVELLMKSTQKSIDEYQERIDNILNPKPEADKPKKTSIEDLVNKTPELKALRDRLSELKDIHDNLKDEAKPKLTPEEVALYAFKKRMASKIAELQDRIDRGDYAPAPEKPKVILDDHAKYLQTEVNKLQRKFDENREKIRLANRTTLEKRLDWISKYRRFILLSNVTTIAKLAAAGATRVVTSPLEEVAGYGLSFVPGLDKVSKMAPREGAGLSIEAEARSLAEVLSKRTLSEMYRTVKEGKSQLDERVDDKDRTYKENSAFELPGRIHAALKTVPKQIEYYRSLTKRIAWALRNGYDITSPDVQTSIQMDAFKEQYPTLFTGKSVAMSELEKAAFNDGKRAIFMQDNFLSDNWQAMIKRWETQGRKGEVAAMIAHVFLPIIKIPTNFVAETSSYAFGGVKAVLALSKGIEKLTPEDADYVMRALKKQSVGAGFFALGYFLPNAVGGFYQQGEKRKKDGPQADDLLIFGEPVPHWLMHAPVFEVMQMGATVRRIHEEYKKNKNVGAVEEGLIDLYATGKGLIGQVPLFGEPADIARGGENWESMKTFAANFVLGIVAPYDVQRVAKWMDEDSHGKPVQRKEKGFIQHIKGGVPVLREELKKK